VGFDEFRGLEETAREMVVLLEGSRGDCDSGSFHTEALGNGGADAAARARHQGDTSVEFSHESAPI
jgi:hypothetical protein